MIASLENDQLCIKVNSLGAELWSVYDKTQKRECLWQGEPDVWPWRAPNLFPVCGRLREGKAKFAGKEYPMPLHGFLRDYEHQLVFQSKDKLCFRMTDSEETRKMYPFAFCVETEFCLKENGLLQTFFVTNSGNQRMSFSIGFHTGWKCPFDENHLTSDYRIIFEKEENTDRILNQDLIIIGRTPFLCGKRSFPVKETLFTPNLVLEGLQSHWLRLEEKESKRFIQVGIEGFPALVLWSVPNNMPFLCIEPWHGMFEPQEEYGEFEEKPFVRKLLPGERFSCCMSVTLG